MRNMKKRMLSLLLSMVMCVSLVPIQAVTKVKAETKTTKTTTEKKKINLGTNGVAKGDQIYYGKYKPTGSETSNPISWRVLDEANGNATGSGDYLGEADAKIDNGNAMFLLSEYALEEVLFNYAISERNVYHDSNVQKWCNETFYQSTFSTNEKALITKTTKTDPKVSDYYFEASSLSGDNVFLLSGKEVFASSYFAGEDGDYDKEKTIAQYAGSGGNVPATWWLRSPSTGDNDQNAGVVFVNGVPENREVSYSGVTVRPAFNLNRESVLFTSAAVGGKESGTVGEGALNSVDAYTLDTSETNREWKTTIKDTAHKYFTAKSTDSTVTSRGYGYTDWSVDVEYSGAQTGENEYVSAMLCDENENVLYYGNIAKNSASGTKQTVDIPDGLSAGNYTLKIFAEQKNDDKKTDYASDFKEVSLTVDSRRETPKAAFTATSDKDGTLSDVTTDMEYSVDGEANWIRITEEMMSAEKTIHITGVTTTNGIKVHTLGDGTNSTTSYAQDIGVTRAAMPSAGSFTKTNCSEAGNDGKISNVSDAMEYRVSGTDDWTSVGKDATEITGLSNKTYQIRVKANGTTLASKAVSITIKSYQVEKITLGTDGIAKGNQIYYGSYTPSGGTSRPMNWRVLDEDNGNATGSNDYLGEENAQIDNGNAMFLLSEYALENVKFNNNYSDGNDYQGSSIQTWCNNTFYTKTFSEKEQALVTQTTKTDPKVSDYYYGASSLLADSVFLLSGKEVFDSDYFAHEDGNYDRRKRQAQYADGCGSGAARWWLRSPDSLILAGVVDEYGSSHNYAVNYSDVAVRPAFNLNKKSVLFTSAAVDGKKSGTVGEGGLTEILAYTGNEWKVTIKDSAHKDFTAKATDSEVTSHGYGYTNWSVDVDYSGAQTGENEYVSAMLCDESGNVLYYGNIANNSASGTQSVKIPKGLSVGKYTLKLFAEQVNGNKKTDYASDFEEVSLTVGSKAETPKATFTATSDKGGALSNVTTSMEYSVDGGTKWTKITKVDAENKVSITDVTTANGVKVRIPGDESNIVESDIQTINVSKADTPKDLIAVNCITSANNDGKITGVNDTMEYKVEGSKDAWKSVEKDAKEITGLSNQTYLVRVKAKDTILASDAISITIKVYVAPTTETTTAQTKPTVKEKISIRKASVSKIKATTYTGYKKKPSVTVKYRNKKLKKGRDYTISYKKNIKVGTAKLILKGKGTYTGTKTVTFKIKKRTKFAKGIYVVKTKALKGHIGPSNKKAINAYFKKGDKLTIIKVLPKKKKSNKYMWLKVKQNKKTSYVYARYLKL